MDTPDHELLSRSTDIESAFGAFFDRHFHSIYRFLARRVGPADAEPLTIEVFTRAFERRSSFAPLHETALPWLYGLATNVLAEHRRAERRHLRTVGATATPARSAFEDEAASRADAQAAWPAVVTALRRLSAKDRDTILLSVWGNLTYEEIATALDVPIGTVRSRINRARRNLRKELRRWNPSTESTTS